MSQTIARRVIIHGRVQQVGFRNWTLGAARKHGVYGWVRNRSNGTVEALFCGSAQQVEAMIAACYKGPLLAAVERIEQHESHETGHSSFTRLPSS